MNLEPINGRLPSVARATGHDPTFYYVETPNAGKCYVSDYLGRDDRWRISIEKGYSPFALFA